MKVSDFPSIKRVVSCFILTGVGPDGPAARKDLRIAVFHRKASMPTFPSHWAACSGSIEPGEAPWQTCRRELMEETNLNSELAQPHKQSGLYVDVPLVRTKEQHENQNIPQRPPRTIRVYPFTVAIPASWTLKMRGTEHDRLEWITVDQLEHKVEYEPMVPSLVQAFHHATAGRYLKFVTPLEREWASDHIRGAGTMARRAVELLLLDKQADPRRMIMMRPSMVAINNALQPIIKGQMQAQEVLSSLDKNKEQSDNYATSNILSLCRELRRRQQQQGQQQRPLQIATHSRSSTLLSVLQRVLTISAEDENNNTDKIVVPLIQRPILCGQSTPGNEGELLARDLNLVSTGATIPAAISVDDDTLYNLIAMANVNVTSTTTTDHDKGVDLLLVGADCICQDAIFNKVGTKRLAEAAASAAATISASRNSSISHCHVVCCADPFKLWFDVFPPPLEDMFESVPFALFDRVLVPPMERRKPPSQL